MKKDLFDPFFVTVLACFIFFALAWGLILPVHEGPDEQNHYRYIVFLEKNGRLPRQLPLPPEVAGEGHQPPLYYFLQACALRLLNPQASWAELPRNPKVSFNGNVAYFLHFKEEGFLRFSGYALGPHLLRVVQIVFPVASLCFLWVFLSLSFSNLAARRLSFCLFALNPAWVSLAGSLNNDHAVILFFSAAVLWLGSKADQAWTGLESLGLGILLGLGALSKITALALVPLALAYLFFGQGAQRWKTLASFCAGFLGTSAWFFGRDFLLYGDWLGWKMHLLTCPNTVHPKAAWDLAWLAFWLRKMSESFWGLFGWYTWSLPFWMINLFLLVCGFSLLGFFFLKRPFLQERRAKILFASGLLLVAGVYRFNLNFDPPEGRYLYPGLLIWGSALCAGLQGWLEKAPKLASQIGWTALFLMVCLQVWLIAFCLIPHYYVI